MRKYLLRWVTSNEISRINKYMSFTKCLAYGKEGEEYAKRLFNGYDELINAPDGKFSEWDFCLRYGDDKKFYEVKRDTYTSKTGNICIEFESNSIPSGISVTTADYYIYIVEGEPVVYIIPVEDIKLMIAKEKYHRKMKGGYRWLSHFYLFRRELFDSYKHVV